MEKNEIELLKIKRREERQKKVAEKSLERGQRTPGRIEYNSVYLDPDYEGRIRNIIKYTREGYTVKEIADFMNCDEEYIKMLIGFCSKWFTEEQLASFANKRKQQEAKAPVKDRDENVKPTNNKRINEELDVINDSLKMMRLSAQREDELQLSGVRNVGTQKRKKFAKVLTRIYNLGGDVNNEDIEILLDMLYTTPDIVTTGNIRFLVLNAFKKGGKEETSKMIDELRVSLRESEFCYMLSDYDSWINGKSKSLGNKRERDAR